MMYGSHIPRARREAADERDHRKLKGPIHRRITAQLLEDIVDGASQPAAFLPTETALAQAFGVSRGTIRQALKCLDRLNLIATGRGSRTRIRCLNDRMRVLRPVQHPREDAKGASQTVISDFSYRTFGPLPAPLREIPLAGLGGGWEHYRCTRQVLETGRYFESLMLYKHVSEFQSILPDRPLCVHASLQWELSVAADASAVSEFVTSVAATEAMAEQLALSAGSPALRILRYLYDAKGDVFAIAESFSIPGCVISDDIAPELGSFTVPSRTP